MPKRVSLVVIAQNSEKNLGACLDSARDFVSEIVVVDGFSGDGTAEAARRRGARVFQRELKNFGEQKQYALDQASGDWVLLLDSDETASPELLRELGAFLDGPENGAAAFRVPRRNYHFGKWLRHGGKYPDYQTRFLKKGAARFSPDIVHEKVLADGPVLTARGWIDHFSYPDKDVWLQKLKLFSEFRALELEGKGVRPSLLSGFRFCVWRPATRFVRRYGFKLGFLDGAEGFLACLHDALTEILTYLLLKEKFRRQAKKGD